jgi:hypothetical protein
VAESTREPESCWRTAAGTQIKTKTRAWIDAANVLAGNGICFSARGREPKLATALTRESLNRNGAEMTKTEIAGSGKNQGHDTEAKRER